MRTPFFILILQFLPANCFSFRNLRFYQKNGVKINFNKSQQEFFENLQNTKNSLLVKAINSLSDSMSKNTLYGLHMNNADSDDCRSIECLEAKLLN